MAPPWGPEGGAPPGRLDNIPLWEAPPDPNKLLFNRINAYRQAGTGPLGSILRVAGEEVPRPLADLMMREIPVPAFVRRLAESPLGRFGGRALGFATKALTPLAVIQQGMEGFNAGTSYGSWRDRVLSGMGTEADYERLARDLNPSFAASPETYAHAAQVLVDHALSNARPGDPDNPEAQSLARYHQVDPNIAGNLYAPHLNMAPDSQTGLTPLQAMMAQHGINPNDPHGPRLPRPAVAGEGLLDAAGATGEYVDTARATGESAAVPLTARTPGAYWSGSTDQRPLIDLIRRRAAEEQGAYPSNNNALTDRIGTDLMNPTYGPGLDRDRTAELLNLALGLREKRGVAR